MFRLLYAFTALLRGDVTRAADLALPIVLIFLCALAYGLFTTGQNYLTTFTAAPTAANIAAPLPAPTRSPTFTPDTAATIQYLESQLTRVPRIDSATPDHNATSTAFWNPVFTRAVVATVKPRAILKTPEPDYTGTAMMQSVIGAMQHTPTSEIPCDDYIYTRWKNGKSDHYAPPCATPSGPIEKSKPPTVLSIDTSKYSQ